MRTFNHAYVIMIIIIEMDKAELSVEIILQAG